MNNKMNIQIYTLTDPITSKIRYVGKSVNAKVRLYKHINLAKTGNKRHISLWISKLLLNNLTPILNVIEECDELNWAEREIYWIDFYKGNDLCNHSKGGEGAGLGHKNCVGRKYSQETINKFKQKRGKKIHSLETKIKFSISAKKRIFDKNGHAKKCVHIKTNVIFNSVKEACIILNIHYAKELNRMNRNSKLAVLKKILF